MASTEPKPFPPHLNSVRDWIRQVFFGICMGAADIVPGISGGSMALILGIYEDLIFAVKSLGSKEVFSLLALKFKTFSKAVSWDFILGLLIGIFLSLATLSQTIQFILGHEVYRIYLYALFNGLILASVFVCRKQIKQWKGRYLWAAAFGAVATFLVTGTGTEPVYDGPQFDVWISSEKINLVEGKVIGNYDPGTKRVLNISESTLAAMLAKGYVQQDAEVFNREMNVTGRVGDFVKPQAAGRISFWLIACGAIGVCAMLLPGVSGSYLLTILGVYPLVIGAIADFVHGLELDAFVILMNVGVGIIFGALLFSRGIAWLLRHYHATTLTMLIGFMIGALRTVWPFWSYEYLLDPLKLEKGPQLHLLEPYIPSLFMPVLWISVLVAIGGFVLVYALERFASRMNNR
ncbi:MAG: DUF368 domain-containing protein [Waddliaceae bacterium]